MISDGNRTEIPQFLKNSPPLKPLSQINRNLVGSIHGKSSITFGHIVPIR